MPICSPAVWRQSGTHAPPGQSAFVAHARLLLLPPSQPSEQPFGLVANPGREHEPAAPGGQSLSSLQRAPRLFDPVPQRSAPHTPPAPHCASFLHGAPGVGPPPHVSHGHLYCSKPEVVHGSVASSVLTPVVVGRNRMSRP